MAFVCQNAERIKEIDFLVCEKMKKEGKTYKTVAEYTQIYCPFQFYCGKTRRNENTDDARNCKKNE